MGHHTPKTTGDWQCKICGMYQWPEPQQIWDSVRGGPICNYCFRYRMPKKDESKTKEP
jgi:hypothetical protein